MRLTLKTTKNELKRRQTKTEDPDWRCVEVYIGNDPPPGGGSSRIWPRF